VEYNTDSKGVASLDVFKSCVEDIVSWTVSSPTHVTLHGSAQSTIATFVIAAALLKIGLFEDIEESLYLD